MRALLVACASLSCASSAIAAPLTKVDRNAVARLPTIFTAGWLHNSRSEVMDLFAPDAVFIPHDGVRPHVGKRAIEQFWFPPSGAAGTVTAFTMRVDGITGEADHAIVWGRSDLRWRGDKTAYHWPGYYLLAATRRQGKWLVTHLMSSDEQPTRHPAHRR